jgi:hypothetical protein
METAKMAEPDMMQEQSRKLNVIIALLLHISLKEDGFASKKRRGTGEIAVHLKRHGLEYQDIAAILDSSIASVRELVSRGTRTKR